MVKSIFLEKKTLSKNEKTFINFSFPFGTFFLDVTIKNVNYSHELFLSSVSNNRRGQLSEECEFVTHSQPCLGPAHFTQHMSESESEKSVSIYQSTK